MAHRNGTNGNGTDTANDKKVEEGNVDLNAAAAAIVGFLHTLVTSPTLPEMAKTLTAHKTAADDRVAAGRVKAAYGYLIASSINNVVFLLALAGCLTFLFYVIKELKPDKDLLLPVLSSIISLIAGAGGGFVFGRHSVPQNTK